MTESHESNTGPTPLLEARGLSKDYGDTRALDSLDLAIAPGEVYCLLGPNGAGKTTTINLFLGFVAPSAGEALVSGLNVSTHDRESKRRLAYIPEQVMLYRNLSGIENLEYFAALGGQGSLGRERLVEILVEAGLDGDAAGRRVSTYSKGMRQKVGIAIAIAKKADALLLVSLAHGWVQARKAHQEHAAAQATAREHWETQGEKNPHSAAHYGVYAFKPRLALSFVDEGVDPFTGTSVWLEAHRQNDFLLRPAQDATAAQRIGALTAAQVLQHLVPLLIILLTFGAFASERERGTLRQLLATGVGWRELALGKALGASGALALLLVPAAVAGAAALVVANPGPTASPLARGAVLAGAYLAYFVVFLALSLAVSARARSSRTALVFLLAVWVVNGLVAPRVAVDLSKRVYPTPSAFEFARTVEREMADGVEDIAPPDREESTERLLAEYGVERVEDLPINAVGAYLQESEEFGNRIFDRNYGALWDAFRRQGILQEALAAAAPSIAVRTLSMGLAGTDVEQHRHFAEAAETYRRDLMRQMNGDMTENSLTGDFSYAAGAELWESVPPLEYEAPPLAWVLGNRILSLGVLGAWLVGAVLLASAQVRRAEVA